MVLIEGTPLHCILELRRHFTHDNARTIFECLDGYEGLVLSVDIAPGRTFMSDRRGAEYIIVMA
jgi:hypothetical protein